MKKFYDCGIDLGTTNSCIAVPNLDNTCTIVENVTDRMQVTPSVVWINQRGRIVIGQRAYTCINVQDVIKEFKRDMGTETVYEFSSAGITKTPEELSSEILQSLRRDAESRMSKDMKDVVVTVPAAFSMVQCEATKKAAIMAGFRNCVLLQEPIAASIAYGAQPNAKDQHWLVFGYGGGTLDVSVISTVDGRLDNITSVGNNHMGGKDLDRILFEKVICKKLEADYDLTGGLNASSKAQIMQFVENCKVELSSQQVVDFEIYDIKDNSGEIMDGLYEISREEFEAAINDEVQAAIDIAKDAISKSGIDERQFTKIILVGGTTFIPLVKNKLRENFSIELDSSLNPMTVVAEGAALYAASLVIEELDLDIQKSTDDLLVDLEYESMTSEEKTNVIGKVLGANGKIARIKIDCIATEDAESAIWTSGWCEVLDSENALFDIDVQIGNLNGRNIYRVCASTIDGTAVPLVGYIFEILHKETALKLSKPPMPYAFGILVTDGKENRIDWLVPKDTKLPISVTESYYLNKALVPTQKDVCEILLYEGDGEKFTYNPDANFLMRKVHINSEELTRTLEIGTKVDITIDIDESRCVTITGSVPMYGYDLMTETLSSSDENYTNYTMQMDKIEKKLVQTAATINILKGKGINVGEIESELAEIKNKYDYYYDLIDVANDQVHQYIESFYEFQTRVIMMERDTRDERQDSSADNDLSRIERNINTYGNDDHKRAYADLRAQYNRANGVESKNFILGKLDRLESDVVLNNIEFLKLIYLANFASSLSYTNMQRAAYWKDEANKAIASNNKQALMQAINNLSGLKIKTAGEDVSSSLADLKK